MDRYVIREPRAGTNYPQGNHNMTYTTNAGGNHMMPHENFYYEGYPNEFSNVPPMRRMASSAYIGSPQMNPSPFAHNLVPHGQVMSGIDPRYLAGYTDNTAHYIATGQSIQREMSPVPMTPRFGNDYQNRSFPGPEKSNMSIYSPQTVIGNETQRNVIPIKTNFIPYDDQPKMIGRKDQRAQTEQVQQINVPVKKPIERSEPKQETQILMMTRSDKLKALHKSGPRAFSGPVEKVLKWHKALQDIGVFVFYEIVAKCVSVRSGESCAKNLVVRDDNGPAMQVVYYEVDFLLPELKPPCAVRIIGRMMAGTCRLQAFSVRLAMSDDVATLPRRAAVASHHVARLCKEYGISI